MIGRRVGREESRPVVTVSVLGSLSSRPFTELTVTWYVLPGTMLDSKASNTPPSTVTIIGLPVGHDLVITLKVLYYAKSILQYSQANKTPQTGKSVLCIYTGSFFQKLCFKRDRNSFGIAVCDVTEGSDTSPIGL